MAKSLVMVFMDETGKKVNYTISNIKDSITKEDVTSVMNTILTKNIFSTDGGSLKSIESASVIDRNVTQLLVK